MNVFKINFNDLYINMDNAEMKKHVCSLINDDKVFIPIATEAFKAIDLDNNNCIDKEEFKECHIKWQKDLV